MVLASGIMHGWKDNSCYGSTVSKGGLELFWMVGFCSPRLHGILIPGSIRRSIDPDLEECQNESSLSAQNNIVSDEIQQDQCFEKKG